MDGVSSAQRWTRAMFLSLLPWIPKKTREGSSSELLDVAGVNIGRISIRIGQNNLSKHAGKKSGSIIEDKSFRSSGIKRQQITKSAGQWNDPCKMPHLKWRNFVDT